jgi:hypothetical protein
MLAFFIFKMPNHPNPDDFPPRALTHNLLRLDSLQHLQFEVSVQKHRENIRDINQQYAEVLRPYFKALLEANPAPVSDQLASTVQSLELAKIQATFIHFAEVKAILRSDQMPYYEDFIEDALARIFANKKNMPRLPRDF